MKVPKAEKLPSGSWRIRICVDGQKQSVTANTKKEAEMQALALKTRVVAIKKAPLKDMTVKQAEERYIEEYTEVLSPSTIAGYKRLSKNTLKELQDIKLSKLTNDEIQKAISRMIADGSSPKYISNAVGFLSSVLKKYHPKFERSYKMPKKRKLEQRALSVDEMAQICAMVKGTEIELPVLMAMWMGMRMSEIIGAKVSDIKDGRLHIQRAMVLDENGEYVEKCTKTYSSNRWVNIPEYILSLIDMDQEHIVNITGSAITNKMYRLSKENSMEHFRFHDLRHANAAIMMRLGIDAKYAQERNGWSTDYMYRQVYGYTHQDALDDISKSIDNFMISNVIKEGT